MLAALLESARPAAIAGGELTLAWPESAGFFKRKAEDPANQELIARAIRAVTGSSLRLAYELRADGELAAAPTPRPRLSEEELVERFVRGVRRRGPAPEEEPLMPQPPNLNKMLEQAQQMLAQQQEAQEKLKRGARRGDRGRRHGQGRDDRRPARARRWRSTPTRSTPRTSRCSRTWSSRPSTRRCARPRSSSRARWAAPAAAGGFDPMSALDALAASAGSAAGGPGGAPGAGGLPGGAPNRAARRRKR